MKPKDPAHNFVSLPPDAPDVMRALNEVSAIDVAIIAGRGVAEVHAAAERMGIKPASTVQHFTPDDAEQIDAMLRTTEGSE